MGCRWTGAHAFDGDLTRSWNAARLDAYRSALGHGSLPPGGDENGRPRDRRIRARHTPATDGGGPASDAGGQDRIPLGDRLG
jgi:hypothetical protein